MDLLTRFKEYIESNHLFTVKETLLLAVSGGVDSVVLSYLCKKAGFPFAIAHCNFDLRGMESQRDAVFVEELASELGVPFYSKTFNTRAYAEANKVSIQVAARELRYHWFQELLTKRSIRDTSTHHSPLITHVSALTYIATAHHADDNIETVLMNLFKSTGMAGLHGILPKSGKVVRPLLFAPRMDVLNYAQEQQLKWVEDSSNAETKYTRNYIRHEILPVIEKAFPAVRDNISKSIHRLREAEVLYQQAVEMQKRKLLECKGNEVYIPVLKLNQAVPLATVVYEIIKEYGFTGQQVPEVLKLLSSDSGKYIVSPSHRILRNRAWLIISPLTQIKETVVIIEETTLQESFAGGELHFRLLHREEVLIEADPMVALVDSKMIQYPLILRRWKEGDYFYPLGMPKKKKVARFLIDQKRSQLQKENTWVVESNKRIIWIVGQRIDDRFKFTPSTKEALKITFKPKD